MNASHTTYSLTQLAMLTGTGKANIRAMIEAGALPATRAESGRKGWIVRRDDAVAANLRFPSEDEQWQEVAGCKPGGASGIDAAMHDLIAKIVGPIEIRLVRIEGQNAQLIAMVDDLNNGRSTDARRRRRFRQICSELARIVRRLLALTDQRSVKSSV